MQKHFLAVSGGGGDVKNPRIRGYPGLQPPPPRELELLMEDFVWWTGVWRLTQCPLLVFD